MSQMGNFWVENEHTVSLVTLRDDIKDQYPLHSHIKRIHVRYFWPSKNGIVALKNYLIRLSRLRSAITNTRPDVVISFIDKTNINVLLSLLGNAVPVIVSERCDPSMTALEKVWAGLRKLTYPRAAAVVAQTDQAAGWLRETLQLNNVSVIANAVEPTPLLPNHERKCQVVAMGRLTEQKGFDLLLESWAKVGPNKSWTLGIIGEGEQRNNLERLAESLGIKRSVHFYGNVDTPADILRESSFFVLSSRYEGFPNALLEAMANGLPAVSFGCPSGPQDIIRDGIDGFLVPPEDTEQLSDKIKLLIENKPLREKLSTAATQVSFRFSTTGIMAKWNALIAEVVRH